MSTIVAEAPKTLPRDGLPDLVLFKNQHGKMRLGEIQQYPEEDVNRAYAQNCYIIEDVVTGSLHKMRIGAVQAVTVPKDMFKDACGPGYFVVLDAWRNYWQEQAEKVDDALQEFGVGAYFTVGVGDGGAHYVVTAVKKTTCNVEWRGFGMDSYFDQFLGGGGSFRIKDIAHLCGRYPKKHIFAKRRMPGAKTWKDIEATGLVPKGMTE